MILGRSKIFTPEDAQSSLAGRIKELRLINGWKRQTLAKRSGVTLASLKRFETTSKISFENLIKLAHALGRLNEFEELFKPPKAKSIAELEQRATLSLPKRGRL